MRVLKYDDGVTGRNLRLVDAFEVRQSKPRLYESSRPKGPEQLAAARPQTLGARLQSTLRAQQDRIEHLFVDGGRIEVAEAAPGQTTVIPTHTLAVDSPRAADLKLLRTQFGLVQIREDAHGKVLLRASDDADDPVRVVFDAAHALHAQRDGAATATPNFLRVLQRTKLDPHGQTSQWAHRNDGSTGIIGADVHADAAWTITRGNADVRVAVLDEGVDGTHPNLDLVAELDVVDGNPTSMPSADDAHGTACAGIIAGQSTSGPGLAPEVSLVGIRIAKSNNQGLWIFDDYQTANAIDWAWDEASCAVLSNSWGGGPPSALLRRAFDRAMTNGRDGRGTVVVAAAGNSNASAPTFPSNLPGVITVGASNQWDERKHPASDDGENWWGSNYGTGLDVLAPGVCVATTDIAGQRGYSRSNHLPNFNGTSAATPFVAAAAALMLSVNSDLSAADVRRLLNENTDPLTAKRRWSKYTGYGRLNAYMAVWAARR